ncbi:MAG: SAM-dependent methyltransferase [Lachnospiraceae bacterium]|nr:SAM-dependent methyltransferase [Lachnospiraceae bacterium]MBO7633553.1 SAM-dependent methyltransferase [Lachnospiraceae bacterium]
MMSALMAGRSGTVADVGCDHAHTCIWLLENGMAERCIGMDVRFGPLKKAEENLELYGQSERTELRLGYGLDKLLPGEADTIVIAGMGGDMIRDILDKDSKGAAVTKNKPYPFLVLQPQSHFYNVRRWLFDNGFEILNEDFCEEDGKFYPCIRARAIFGYMAEQELQKKHDAVEICFGPKLIERKHPVLIEFLEIEYRKVRYRLDQIAKSDTDEARAKKAEVERFLEIICEARRRCGVE